MIKDIIQNVYSKRPLVHNITNYVAATDCANITLTIGASPIMADESKEVGEVTQISDGLVLNCGTISESRLNAMLISGKTAKSREIPIVLDPVGVGISKFRTSAVHKIITEVKPDIIRLNASELKSICLNIKNMSGVDAVNIDSFDDTVELAKKLSLTVGTFVMIYNVILYVICGIAFQSWILPLYSIVAYVVALKTVDYIIEGFDRSKSAMIITTKQKEICKRLSNEFENGITFYNAKGYYSNEDKTVIYFVLNRFQIGKMREIVHSIDPKAYISITEVADIFGANNNKE